MRDNSPERRRGYEVALDRGALTAFQLWLEVAAVATRSAPARFDSIDAGPGFSVFAQALIAGATNVASGIWPPVTK